MGIKIRRRRFEEERQTTIKHVDHIRRTREGKLEKEKEYEISKEIVK